ncbi:MAG: DUF4867 family protein [Bacilli bacterium]|nr:DUF4867 family protein [Bacilli bacterium]
MEIIDVHDPRFLQFGRVLQGDFKKILNLLQATPMPEQGTIYVGSDPQLEEADILSSFSKDFYGDMPVQVGYCNGHNQKLNCLEYHKGNEINMANEDFILLLASFFDIENGKLDTSKVVAFRVPAGVAVEVYATSLHYAPCGINGSGFKTLVVLPRNTNEAIPLNPRDPPLWARNKWLLAHPESNEAKAGADVGLVGENIEI